jgi:hypothetical protein
MNRSEEIVGILVSVRISSPGDLFDKATTGHIMRFRVEHFGELRCF